jgi:orotate phosphoribosyltransferase
MSLDQREIELIHFLVGAGVLRFGDFTGKSGRRMPYFLDAGRYRSGHHLEELGRRYADRLEQALGDGFDVLFGPAYKGIPLVVATAMHLARRGRDVGYCFNRKEAKDHGEGGVLVGHRLRDGDRVVIVEDVTTAGTSIHETVPLLRAAADVRLVSLIVSVDRQERGSGTASALSELAETYAMQTLSLLTIDQIVGYLRQHPVDGRQLIDAKIDAAIDAYRQRYGA